ncbi:E3 ubiquitin-protein ligase TRIM71-like [Saccoglossus kowalevskii]
MSLRDENSEVFLSCSICLEILKDPKLLPCLHTFCQKCLVDFKDDSGGVLSCKTCKIQCDTPIQELKSNFFISSLLDRFQRQKLLSTDQHSLTCEICQEKTATHRCVDCPQFCCDVCVTIHGRIPALRSHEVLTIDEYKEKESRCYLMVQSKVFCSDHKDTYLEFYCDTCQVPVCLKCTIVNHRVPEHVHRDLQEVADEYKTQLREMLGQLKVKEKQMEEEKATAVATREEIQNQCAAEKVKVMRRAQEVIERVKREEKMLIDALDESATMELKAAAMNIDEKEFHHGNIVSTHHYLNTLVHHGNAIHLLSTKLETMSHIKEMVAMETKPPISDNITEFHPGSDLARHTLMGVIKTDACPSKCTVENLPKQLLKGESANLLITTRDSREKQIIPRQGITVKTMNPDAPQEDIDVTDNNDGTCNVMITGKMVEKHQVAMTIGNQHISGSPFHISVPSSGWLQTVGKAESEGQLSADAWGITVNKHSDFVTADKGNNRVTIHDREGNYKQSFTFTDQFAEPFKPCDVVISDDNEYFMLDDRNKQVVVSDEYGKLIRKFGSSELDNPCGIAINPATKHIYVSEFSEGCIRKYTKDGVYIKTFRKGINNKLYMLAINSDGLLYVVNFGNHCVEVFDSDEQFIFEFSSLGDNEMITPSGVAVDRNDYVYVSSLNQVTKHETYGQFICRIDDDSDGLIRPCGVAVCNDGRIAVVDCGNRCVKVFEE